VEQILKAKERPYDFRQEKAYRSRGFSKAGQSAVDPKAARLPDKFRAKDYLTGAYGGQKSYWKGDFQFETKKAPARPAREAGKAHVTKAVPVNAYAGQKQAGDAVRNAPTRDYRGPEADAMKRHYSSEQASGLGWRGNLQELNIDEIRELLNKSK